MIWIFVMILATPILGKEKILADVPYRNQVLDFPGWSANWASCGYTSTLMNLLYCEAIPNDVSEQSYIENMYKNCSITTGDGSVIFYYEKLDEFCEQFLPEAELEVSFIRGDFENNIKKMIDEDNPVICGTYIFGDVGHVILIVGYDDENWIVHDPANAWGQECWPTNGFAWENAAFARFPIGSFTILYGASISSEKNKEYAAKIEEQSPTVILEQDGKMQMLWVKMTNTGQKDWQQDKIHLGTYQPIDRHCGLVAKNSPEKYRWLGTDNRIVMEQKIVKPGQVALFGIPMEKNGFIGIFPERFRLIRDDDGGGWFGPVVGWQVEGKKSAVGNTSINHYTGKYVFHPGSIHNHTTWSGEKKTIANLIEEKKKDGLEWLAITDEVEKIKDKTALEQYLKEIKQASQEKSGIVVAGLEYGMNNFGNKVNNHGKSAIKIIGLGYNNLTATDWPEWFPWTEKKISIQELIDWHQKRNLPVIIAQPLDKDENGWSSVELIEKGLYPNLEKICGLEVFSQVKYPAIASINGQDLLDMINSDNNLARITKLYENWLGTVGIGVVGGNEPALTTIVNKTTSLDIGQILESLSNKRTTASQKKANFDFIKINGQEWAPGKWDNDWQAKTPIKIAGEITWPKNSNQHKIIYLFRDYRLVEKKIIAGQNILNFEFIDKHPKTGKHDYQIAVSDDELLSGQEDKIFTSPLEVVIDDGSQIDLPMETINSWQKELLIELGSIHLGDSFYEGDINKGFNKKDAEGIITKKVFSLGNNEVNNLQKCRLVMEICGAQSHPKSKLGDPIMINCQQIGQCLIPGDDPKKNNLEYTFDIPINILQVGNNEFFVRALPRAYLMRNGRTFLDFDDFEIRNVRLIFNYNKGSENKGTRATVTAQKIPLNEENETLEIVTDDLQQTKDFESESKTVIDDFLKKGGEFVGEDTEKYQKFMQLIQPIDAQAQTLSRQTPIKWKLFESNTLDPIALPDRTILVPTGLIANEKELPENKIFPIVSAIFQSDLGISHKQANRKDLASVLGFLGTVLTKNDNTITKYIGMGMLLAGSLSLKSESEDFYLADAYAADWMKNNGLQIDQAFTLLDAADLLEKERPNESFYLLAPPAKKRLEALTKYTYWQNTYPVPIAPEMIDWEKVVNENKK